jgi:hypothetical protein
MVDHRFKNLPQSAVTSLTYLVDQYGLPRVVKQIALLAADRGFAKNKRPPGAPVKWVMRNDKGEKSPTWPLMHVWLTVEIICCAWNKRIKPALKELFPRSDSKPWRIDFGDKTIIIKTAGRARKLHSDAQSFMKNDAVLAKQWKNNLEIAKRIIGAGSLLRWLPQKADKEIVPLEVVLFFWRESQVFEFLGICSNGRT